MCYLVLLYLSKGSNFYGKYLPNSETHTRTVQMDKPPTTIYTDCTVDKDLIQHHYKQNLDHLFTGNHCQSEKLGWQ